MWSIFVKNIFHIFFVWKIIVCAHNYLIYIKRTCFFMIFHLKKLSVSANSRIFASSKGQKEIFERIERTYFQDFNFNIGFS